MSLTPGSKLGPYEIESSAGAGGMGEVYKARDSRLDRVVAIKVLPTGIADNPDLRARFEREAKAISSLNHPNICTLHDVGHENGTEYLVMEYIEGETLADKLEKGPLPLEESLRIGMQIADALDKAHGQGLVHRDLKPANIMLTKEGAKLLDFGLAKLSEEGGVVQGVSGITQTTPLTGAGMILGTMQYMAPEQLEGKESDGRSDIFAFGAVMYEMVTGKRAFEGGSQASLIAAILEREPTPLSSIAPMSPPALDRLVKKCLQKDPETRWQSVRDLSDELRWISQSGSLAGVPSPVAARRRLRFRLAWGVAVVAGLIAIGFGAALLRQPEADRKVKRLVIPFSTDMLGVNWPRLSPNGEMVAFQAADSSGQRHIWVRPLNSMDAYPLQGTVGARRPFWSHDSRFLAFFLGDQLKKIPVSGGPAQVICKTTVGADGTWGNAGMIVYDGGLGDTLHMVSAAGGTPVGVTSLDREASEQFHAWPWFLPNGKDFVHLAGDSLSHPNGNLLLKVSSTDGSSKTLFRIDSRVEYAEPGYLLYVRDGILLAHAFDLDKLETVGEPIPIEEKISVVNFGSNFAASDDGTLMYQKGDAGQRSALVWLDREGNVLDTIGSPGSYRDLDLSRDGTRLAVCIVDQQTGTEDVWVRNLTRGVASRLTFDDAQDVAPLWSPDGEWVYFTSNRDGRFKIMRRMASGMGAPETVYAPDSGTLVFSGMWMPDGNRMLVNELRTSMGFGMLDLSSSERRLDYWPSNFDEWTACVSPDGRFIAYESDESGRNEVYIRELGTIGGKWQISSTGGTDIRWRPDGKELYYWSDEGELMAVPIEMDNGFRAGIPKELFSRSRTLTGLARTRYYSSHDGQKFLVNASVEGEGGGEFVVVLNWHEELVKK